MALTWQWSGQIGHIEPIENNDTGVVLNLYEGNALLIGIYEKPSSNEYWLAFFFNDLEHARACLNSAGFIENWGCVHINLSNCSRRKNIQNLCRTLSNHVDVHTKP